MPKNDSDPWSVCTPQGSRDFDLLRGMKKTFRQRLEQLESTMHAARWLQDRARHDGVRIPEDEERQPGAG